MSDTHFHLRHVPVPLFAATMGLGGLSLAWRRAALVWNLPSWPWHILFGVTVTVFILVAGAYLAKLIRHPDAVLADLTHPIRMAFVPTITISLLLLATGLSDITPDIARVLWWIGAVGHLVATLYVISSWFQREDINRDTMTPAWLIPIVGNVVTPLAAPAVGNLELAWFSFGIGVIFWLGLWPMLLNRVLVHDNPLPTKLTPTIAIFLAPPSVIALSWQQLTGHLADPVGIVLHAAAVFFALLLLSQVPRLVKLPFSLPILAYTFPVATVATVTVAMAGATGSGFHTALAVIALAAATGIVLGVVIRVAWGAVKGQVFVAE